MSLKQDWKYAVNLAGSEMMLFTNKELVKNLSISLDDIYVESFPMPDGNMFRVENKYEFDAEASFDPDHAGTEYLKWMH